MALASRSADRRPALAPAAIAIVIGALALLFLVDAGAGSIAALCAVAYLAYRGRAWWLAACAVVWALVFVAVLALPGPYDSWAGRAAVPVLAGYAGCFLGGWAIGRRWIGRRCGRRWVGRRWIGRRRSGPAGQRPEQAGPAVRQRTELAWPPERRLRLYLLALLVLAVAVAAVRYRGVVPPLFAGNPDAAREVLRQRANIYEGLLSEAWTLGMSVSLLRALTGDRTGRLLYVALALVFTFGAALGASKNSVLVGIVPAIVAALSVRRAQPRAKPLVTTRVLVLVGVVAVGGAVFLGAQRTLAGSGVFEDEFRAWYGGNPVAASAGSLDLSLSSSAETFGRLWAQRDEVDRRYGAYTLAFLGSPGERLFGKVDLYAITSQLSMPYFMNTATFVAIPLLDYGPFGAAVFLIVLGLVVGWGERRLEYSAGPAQQLGRAFIVYFAVFGVYELYPAIYPTWLSLVPGLWVLYRLGRPATSTPR